MSGGVLYHAVKDLLDVLVWRGELVGGEDLDRLDPAVYIANHALALGPIAVICSIPMRLYPWVVGDMLNRERAPAYLNKDFVERQLYVPLSFSMPLSRLISLASVRLLRSVECIPVLHGDGLLETYRISLDYLRMGRNLLIFPEDPSGPSDEQSGMSPFKKGFARLGEMYFDAVHKNLRFYPLTVHLGLRRVSLGGPVTFNPLNDPVRERLRIKTVLETVIHDTYLEMSRQGYSGIRLPH